MSTAIVVGASRGIGLAITQQLAEQQRFRHLIATHRPASDLTQLQKSPGGRVLPLPYDANEPGSEKVLSQALEQIGADSVELVICALGTLHSETYSPERKIEELQLDTIEHVFRINAFSVAMIAKELKPFVKSAEQARFAAISAKVGSISDNKMGGWHSYRASKAALNMLMKNIAIEFSRNHKNFAAIALHPGTTETELSQPFLEVAKKRYTVHTPEQTAKNLLQIVLSSGPSDNAKFISWNGEELPW
jgi:NAD(P)-dependent dehydrogenase (short-subunit alcohol dehydrogenase family)